MLNSKKHKKVCCCGLWILTLSYLYSCFIQGGNQIPHHFLFRREGWKGIIHSMQTCQLLRIRSTTLYSANTAFRVLSNSKTPCSECSSYQENCAFSSVTCFTCTLSPGANVLSQKSKARVSCVRTGHLSEPPDAAAPANLCSTDMNCRSVSTGFALGYF